MNEYFNTLKIIKFPTSTNIDRVIVDQWHQLISNLGVTEDFLIAKTRLLSLISLLRTEGITFAPLSTLPKRSRQSRGNQLLLTSYNHLTPRVAKQRITNERMSRLKVFYKSMEISPFSKDPFILVAEEDPTVFLVGNMKEADIPYFIALKDFHQKLGFDGPGLVTTARRFVNHFYPPPRQQFSNKYNIIYINTGTNLEAQLALLWGVVAQNSSVDFETKKYLAEVTKLMYMKRRIVPPFDFLPPQNIWNDGNLPEAVLGFCKKSLAEQLILKAMHYESGRRVKNLFLNKFGGQRRKGLIFDFYRSYRVNLTDELMSNFKLKHFQNREKALEQVRKINVLKQVKERIALCGNLPVHKSENISTTPLVDISPPPKQDRYRLPPYVEIITPLRPAPQSLKIPTHALSPERTFNDHPGFIVHKKRFGEQTPPVKSPFPTTRTVQADLSPKSLERFFNQPPDTVHSLITGDTGTANRTFTIPLPETHRLIDIHQIPQLSTMDETLVTTAVDDERDREMVEYSRLLRATKVNPQHVTSTLHGSEPLSSDPKVLWLALQQPKVQLGLENKDEDKNESQKSNKIDIL